MVRTTATTHSGATPTTPTNPTLHAIAHTITDALREKFPHAIIGDPDQIPDSPHGPLYIIRLLYTTHHPSTIRFVCLGPTHAYVHTSPTTLFSVNLLIAHATRVFNSTTRFKHTYSDPNFIQHIINDMRNHP